MRNRTSTIHSNNARLTIGSSLVRRKEKPAPVLYITGIAAPQFVDFILFIHVHHIVNQAAD